MDNPALTTGTDASGVRIGIDLGGTKIAAIGLIGDDQFTDIQQVHTPQNDYQGTINIIKTLIGALEVEMGEVARVGLGMPGSLTRGGGLVQNANSTWLNGKPFCRDLKAASGRDIRFANDANCFALSESLDGAGEGARSLFAVILGTGCGGGLVLDGKIIEGPNRIGGEWGHNPLPWAQPEETPGPKCWCGRDSCMEAWVSGPGMAADHERHTGEAITAEEIAARATEGDNAANETLDRHASRLARGIAMVINIFDPERIVLGGGLSNLSRLYSNLPQLIMPHIFADEKSVDIRPPKHGPASGVRGAARLWD